MRDSSSCEGSAEQYCDTTDRTLEDAVDELQVELYVIGSIVTALLIGDTVNAAPIATFLEGDVCVSSAPHVIPKSGCRVSPCVHESIRRLQCSLATISKQELNVHFVYPFLPSVTSAPGGEKECRVFFQHTDTNFL